MPCNDNSTKLIDLKDVIVKNVVQKAQITEIHIELTQKEHRCPCCGAATRTVHDYRIQHIKDIPILGKNVELILRKRRYRCQCGKNAFSRKTASFQDTSA
ncbi:MAG: transposase family protein [Eubacteriales bacterium]